MSGKYINIDSLWADFKRLCNPTQDQRETFLKIINNRYIEIQKCKDCKYFCKVFGDSGVTVKHICTKDGLVGVEENQCCILEDNE